MTPEEVEEYRKLRRILRWTAKYVLQRRGVDDYYLKIESHFNSLREDVMSGGRGPDG